ncbi:M15 family metallopeptidase [bacterium]|nr:M15 family metallopeptidase [bacterium]
MKKGVKLYSDFQKMGIDPFKMFVGREYEILIPLSGLDRLSYTPAYEKDYRELGILDMTYSVNPTMYVSMYILNKLAKIFDVKFRVIEAWRPFEIQMAKYEAEQKKNPGSTLFLKPDKNVGMPHICGGAIDLLMTDSYGRPFTQPKWLLRKHPELLKQIKALNSDFDNVNNPFFTTHMEPLENADKDLKLSVLNVDILRLMVSSILNLRHINDENWHFQLADSDEEYLPSFKNISISDVRNTSPSHIERVKKEVTDFAERVFGVFYDREFVKGQKHNYTTSEFKKEDVMTLDELKKKVNNLIVMQQNILSR